LEYSLNKHLRSSATARQQPLQRRRTSSPARRTAAYAVGDVFRPAARHTDGRSVAVTRRRPPALRQQRRRMSLRQRLHRRPSCRRPVIARRATNRRPPGDCCSSPGRAVVVVHPRSRPASHDAACPAATIAGRRPFAPPPRRPRYYTPPRALGDSTTRRRALAGAAPAAPSHADAARTTDVIGDITPRRRSSARPPRWLRHYMQVRAAMSAPQFTSPLSSCGDVIYRRHRQHC